MKRQKTPNISDLAKEAGVSTATASRALNKPEAVSKTTRESVIVAAKRIGYRVNIAARNLRRRQTGVIVVLVPDLGNPFFSQILSGIESTASAADLNVVIVDTQQPDSKQSIILDYVHNSRADGIIILDASLGLELMESGQKAEQIPPIVFACEWLDPMRFPSLWIDNKAAAAMAIGHLRDLGHKKIGHICGPTGNVLSSTRIEGVKSELKNCALEVRPEWFYDGDFSIEAGAKAARKWLAQRERPTGVFCASDQMAFGFISELNANGFMTPQHVSVVGFDDIEIAARYIPSLTTIHQPRTEIGVASAKLLISQIKGSDEPAESELFPVELIVRASTGPAPV